MCPPGTQVIAHTEASIDPRSYISTIPDELLLAILDMVPKQNRVGIRAVSKKWKNLISDIGYHVEPLFMGNSLYAPFYPIETSYKLNTCIESPRCRAARKNRKAGSIGIGPPSVMLTQSVSQIEMLQRRSEFATSPPISTLSLIAFGPRLPENTNGQMIHATLRTATPAVKVSEGIRLCDLLDVYAKTSAHDPTSPQGWKFKAYFGTDGQRWGLLDVDMRARTRNGFEVRSFNAENE